MLELSMHERECPSCKQNFYPQSKVVLKTFCGDEQLCIPPGGKYSAPDCKIYYFCSDECVKDFESSVPLCKPVPRWKRLMQRISKVSHAAGIAGARCHQLK
jgi:ribosomal protein L24E